MYLWVWICSCAYVYLRVCYFYALFLCACFCLSWIVMRVVFFHTERERSALPLASLGNKTVDIDRVTDNEFPLFIDNTVFFLHRICENSVPCPCLWGMLLAGLFASVIPWHSSVYKLFVHTRLGRRLRERRVKNYESPIGPDLEKALFDRSLCPAGWPPGMWNQWPGSDSWLRQDEGCSVLFCQHLCMRLCRCLSHLHWNCRAC